MGLKSIIAAAVMSLTSTMVEADIMLKCDYINNYNNQWTDLVNITSTGVEHTHGSFTNWGREIVWENPEGGIFAQETGESWVWGSFISGYSHRQWTINRITGSYEISFQTIKVLNEGDKVGRDVYKGSCELIKRKF